VADVGSLVEALIAAGWRRGRVAMTQVSTAIDTLEAD